MQDSVRPAAPPAPRDDGGADAFPESVLQSAQGAISYRECGAGPRTIVLLHGISSGAASWTQCALALRGHARVIAWNAPGYGASMPLRGHAPSAPDYAARLDALLEGLDVEDCVIVGHSLGALMAAAHAAGSPRPGRAYVLLSPALGYGGGERLRTAEQVRAKRLAALRGQGIAGMAAALPDRLLAAGASQAQRQLVRDTALQLNEIGYAQAVEMLCSDDIERHALDASRAWVYCGDLDVVTPPDQSEAYARGHGLPFGLIPGAGHACYVQWPDEVARLIRDVSSGVATKADA